jgi:hypothetical protein
MATLVGAVCANTRQAWRSSTQAPSTACADPPAQVHQARAVLGLTVDDYHQFATLGERHRGYAASSGDPVVGRSLNGSPARTTSSISQTPCLG